MSIAHALAFRAARRAVRPKAPLTVSEWADANRILSGEGSAEQGQWKTSRTPYLREIMDALSEDAPHRKVVFMKSSQAGGTECGSNWIGYIMAHAKGPVAIVMPTEKSLNDWMAQKFDPMAKDTPSVANVLATRSNRAGDNSAQRKRFTGGIFYAKTAGSTAELKSTSLRYAIADEADEYDWSTLQGDPLGLLEVRLTTFHDRKLFVVSSPTMKDASRIEEQFEAGDQRRYMVPCPHCGERQHLKWANVRWQKNGRRCASAWYACEECGAVIEEHHKPAMLAAGRWIAHNPGAPWPSYHISALYSPLGLGLTWAELADEWIDAQDDPAKLMRFVNTRLGETWADRSHDVKPNVLQARSEPYELRTIPAGCLVLTAGVDVQDDRLEISIIGWGVGEKCWTIDYHVLPGNPSDEKLWARLAEYLNASFTNGCGKTLKIEASAIDTGGHHTHAVYAFVRSGLVRRAIAVKGASTPGRAILGKPSHQDVNWRGQTIKKGVALYSVGADTAKHLLYNRLNGDADKDPGERKVHFSQQLEAAYYDQLVAETFNPRKNRWEIKKGKRNEALDTWVYACAASHHPELYLHKWRAADWERRRQMVEPEMQQHENTSEITTRNEEEEDFIRPRRVKSRGSFATRW
ncbi:MAG: Phage terminase large subunit (GpA) [Betaproteobacteria bacterium ADurb.Bin341]|nr:MAG: Phage terminase large subunit (GpA) [Betaproteobacteria bacterium ADurb.Bin341]